MLYGLLRLPPILPHSLALYSSLRLLHASLGYLLFATLLVHLGAAPLHGQILRDRVLESMASLLPTSAGKRTAGVATQPGASLGLRDPARRSS